MKRYYFLLTLLIFIFSVKSNATIIQVNNNADASADYSLLQTAIDDANSGDTLYISGSPNFYDNTTAVQLNKKLTLIGPGYFLGENGGEANNLTAKLYQLIIGTGADNALIMGLDLSQSSFSFISTENVNRDGTTSSTAPAFITIKRNKIYDIHIEGANAIIEQNFISVSNASTTTCEIFSTASNTVIQNNFFETTGNAIDGNSGVFTNLTIRNNILTGDIHRVNGSEIINNILLDGKRIEESSNGQIRNNLFTSAEATVIEANSIGNSTSDNVFSVSQSSLFASGSPSIDSEYQLSESSPAKDVGFNGVDVGMFGGPDPYRISGKPSIPSITEFTTSGIGTTSEGIRVRIKAKSNQ